MIPDFFQALYNSTTDRNFHEKMAVFFRSANDVIDMWEKCVRSARHITSAARRNFLDRKTENATFNRLKIDIATGTDNLRQDMRLYARLELVEPIGGSKYVAFVLPDGHTTSEFLLNQSDWKNFQRVTIYVPINQVINQNQVRSIELFWRKEGDYAGTEDNWNLDDVNLTFEYTEGGVQQISRQAFMLKGNPLVRFKGSRRNLWRYDRFQPQFDATEIVDGFDLTIITGEDNRDSGQDTSAYLQLKNGTRITIPLGNDDIPSDTQRTFSGLLTNIQKQDIVQFAIRTNMAGGVFGKNWDIAEVKLELIKGSRRCTILHESGYPLLRFMGGDARVNVWRF